MNMFVMYDNESKLFLNGQMGYGKGKSLPQDARIYRRKHAAIDAASLHNTGRSVPPGMTADHKYSNRPKVVVREYDHNWKLVNEHQAPVVWITI